MTEIVSEPPAVDAAPESGRVGGLGLLEHYAPYVAAVALAIPTLLTYYPPMSDLPMHEGVVGVMRHFGEPEYFPKDVYDVNVGHPNQLFHIASWLLSFPFETRWAVKIVIALSQLAIFHSGVRFADHLGRSRWGTMLLGPLALGFTYYWGLVANLIGFSAFLYALPILDRMLAQPRWRTVATSSAMMLVLYLAHESTFMMATGVVVLFTLALPLDRRLTPMRLVPAGFAILVGLGHLEWQTRKFTVSNIHVPPSWFPLRQKVEMLPNVLFGSHEWMGQMLLLTLGLGGLVALLVARTRDDVVAPSSAHGLERARALLHRFRFEALGFAYLVLYFAMPFNWNGVTLLHERFLGPAWAVLVICVAPRGLTPRLAKFAGSVLPVGILLTAWPQFADATQTFRTLDGVFEKIPKGKAVAVCILEHNTNPFGRVYSVGPGPARSLATRGGRAGLGLTTSPISPIRVKAPYRWDEFEMRTFLYGSKSFMPAHDLQRWEYVVAQSRDPSVRAKLVMAFAPEAELVYADGEWLLLHSKNPTLPLDSGDEWPSRANQNDTVLHRIIKIENKAYAEGRQPPPAASPTLVRPPQADPLDAGTTD